MHSYFPFSPHSYLPKSPHICFLVTFGKHRVNDFNQSIFFVTIPDHIDPPIPEDTDPSIPVHVDPSL